MNTKSSNVRRLIASSCACLLFLGCGSDTKPPNPPPAQPAAAHTPPPAETLKSPTMSQFRANLLQGQQQIDTTLASLKELTDPSQQNLRPAYDKYCDNLAQMQQHSETLKREADTMRASKDSYFGSWEGKVSEIDNPTIRASAEARRKRLRDAHEQIATSASQAKDAYVPFMKDLQDIKKYLATDLSKSSVADLGDAAKKVEADGATVKSKLNNIVTVLDQVEGSGT